MYDRLFYFFISGRSVGWLVALGQLLAHTHVIWNDAVRSHSDIPTRRVCPHIAGRDRNKHRKNPLSSFTRRFGACYLTTETLKCGPARPLRIDCPSRLYKLNWMHIISYETAPHMSHWSTRVSLRKFTNYFIRQIITKLITELAMDCSISPANTKCPYMNEWGISTYRLRLTILYAQNHEMLISVTDWDCRWMAGVGETR